MRALLLRSTLLFSSLTLVMCLTDEREILETPDAMGSEGENTGGNGVSSGWPAAGDGSSGWPENGEEPTAGDDFGPPPPGGTAGKASGGGSSGRAGSGDGGRAGLGGSGGKGGGAIGGNAGGEAGPGEEDPEPPCPDLDKDGILDCEQTIVKNPSFVANGESWSPESAVEFTWHAEGAMSSKDAGSITVVNGAQLPLPRSSVAGVSQCVPAEGGRTYALFLQVWVPEEQEGTGSGSAYVSFFNSADCTGNPIREFNSTLVNKGNRWVVAGGIANSPLGVQSLVVRLVAIKPFQDPSFSVRFDDVLVRPM